MQAASAANSLALLNVGINIAINKAIMDITTNNSINVNPFDLFIFFTPESKNFFLVRFTEKELHLSVYTKS